ncbi:hypothetical protein EC973_001220 [Apophysomyces ossiformis]|uniref:sn-1-specific diacylglycerol lipase n=1 Tax=Apophysomyces ossiformis TaxID=679940 RepID=A0A8H7BPB1_9FUNG|nr:hypothetical protein EC973_001220 [Apophysomyces ossiformis]
MSATSRASSKLHFQEHKTPPAASPHKPPLPPHAAPLVSQPAPPPSTVPSRRLSLPNLVQLKEEWACRESLQSNSLPPGKLQIDLLNVRSDVNVKRPLMRLRMGSQHYFSSRSKDTNGNWNEGFLFTVSYHNQLFDMIEFDLYDKRKGWRSKTKHIGKAKLKIARLKGRDEVFLTFLPMYEYHIRRYLPAHIQLPHNFLKSHMPTMPKFTNNTRSFQQNSSHLHYQQHPSHRKNSMTPYIGSIQIRVRYVFQKASEPHSEELMPVYLPFNRTGEFDTYSIASSRVDRSTLASKKSRNSTTSVHSSSSSNLSSSTTYSEHSNHNEDGFHDAVEPHLIYVDNLRSIQLSDSPQDSSSTSSTSGSNPVRSESTVELMFERSLKNELGQSNDSGSRKGGSLDMDQYGFSQWDVDNRSINTAKEKEGSDGASIRSHNFGDKNFAFKWMNESFEEVALSHPSLDRMIGLVVSPQTRTLLRAVVKMANAFGQGFKITGMQLLSSLSLLQTFYADTARPPPAEKIADLQFVDEAYYFLGHAIIAYGWRGLSYLGDYAKYLKDVMKTKSNKEAIVRFLKIPPEDLLGYEYGLRKGAVFQPSYFVSVDRLHEAVVLGIRGTWSLYDCITDLVCEYRPWKGGLVHSGMLASAQWFFTRIIPQIFHYVHEQAKSERSLISSFIITGHSLGAGTAALLTMMVADHIEELRQLSGNPNFKVHCYAYAPVASVSLEISEKYKDYIDSFVCHDDLVGHLSYGTATCAKELIMDTLIAVDGLGGSSKVTSNDELRRACFDIIQARREEIFHSSEPRYPLLYIPGQVYQFRRTPKSKTESDCPAVRPRASSGTAHRKPSRNLPSSQSEPVLLGQSSSNNDSNNETFTLHKSSALISEEVLISKTCLEDHMLVTYLNAFQQVRQDCMRPASSKKEAREQSVESHVPSIRIEDPEGKLV